MTMQTTQELAETHDCPVDAEAHAAFAEIIERSMRRTNLRDAATTAALRSQGRLPRLVTDYYYEDFANIDYVDDDADAASSR